VAEPSHSTDISVRVLSLPTAASTDPRAGHRSHGDHRDPELTNSRPTARADRFASSQHEGGARTLHYAAWGAGRARAMERLASDLDAR
jgi:hypothetical protein